MGNVDSRPEEGSTTARAPDDPPSSPEPALEVEDQDDDCGICLDPLNTKTVVQLMPCPHRFHRSCIIEWLESRDEETEQRCPMCRREVHEMRTRTHKLAIHRCEPLGALLEPCAYLAVRRTNAAQAPSVAPFLYNSVHDTKIAIAQWTWIREEAVLAGPALPYSHTADANKQLALLQRRLVILRQMMRIHGAGGLKLWPPIREPRAWLYSREFADFKERLAELASDLETSIEIRTSVQDVFSDCMRAKLADDRVRLQRMHVDMEMASRERVVAREPGENAEFFLESLQRRLWPSAESREHAECDRARGRAAERSDKCALCDIPLYGERVTTCMFYCIHKYHRACIISFLEGRELRAEQCCPICRLLKDGPLPHDFIKEYPRVPALGDYRLPSVPSVKRGSLETGRPFLVYLQDLVDVTMDVIGDVSERRERGLAEGMNYPLIYTNECDTELRRLEQRLIAYREMQRFHCEGGSLELCAGDVWNYEAERKAHRRMQKWVERRRRALGASSAQLPPPTAPQQAAAAAATASCSTGHGTLEDKATLAKVVLALKRLGILRYGLMQQTRESYRQTKKLSRKRPTWKEEPLCVDADGFLVNREKDWSEERRAGHAVSDFLPPYHEDEEDEEEEEEEEAEAEEEEEERAQPAAADVQVQEEAQPVAAAAAAGDEAEFPAVVAGELLDADEDADAPSSPAPSVSRSRAAGSSVSSDAVVVQAKRRRWN